MIIIMKTYRLHLICSGKADTDLPDSPLSARGAEKLAAEAGRYPRPSKVYYAPQPGCAQTATALYPNLMAVPVVFDTPLSAVKAALQEMMQAGFAESALIADETTLRQALQDCVLPERLAKDWPLTPGRGYTLLTDAALWMRNEKLELYDTVPSSVQDTMYADDEAYLDYAESLLDDGAV